MPSGSGGGTGLVVRVKDVARLVTSRTNQVMGIGLVVGLAGTGDSASNGLTARLAANLLDRLGVALSESQLRARNVAAVMVTAELPPFARSGDRIDVTVSSLGDARSLQGGVLLQTPLTGADGEVYVVAQGSVSVGGFTAGVGAGGGGAGQQKNHPTVGRVPGGGLVEREIPFTLGDGRQLEWVLYSPDFGTASRLASSINRAFRPGTALAQDAATVRVTIPEPFLSDPVAFVAMVEELTLEPARSAQVVINERTGTVVIGADVRVAPVAVAHGNLRVSIEPRYVEVPITGVAVTGGSGSTTPESTATAAAVQVTGTANIPVGERVQVSEEKGSLQLVEGRTSLAELVASLNALGATPRDLIAILQAIKAAGALYGELVVE
ncbi:MAG: flagellar basal body P-ring protein FlgI [Limnochordales bacterium]|nr:flagellar basal body P-ring protein FlgI [Limnochordales bacterium]